MVRQFDEELWNRYGELISGWLASEWGDLETRNGYAALLRAAVDQPPSSTVPRFWVATADGQAVGCASVVADDGAGDVAVGPWLANVFVDEPFRRRGIGRLMVAAAIENALGAGVSEVYLWTDHERSFYEGIGWRTLREIVVGSRRAHLMVYAP